VISRRTLIASALTGSVVVALCAAWYVAASRDLSRRARELREAPRLAAIREASRIAERLFLRLDALREVESRRPFSDYLDDTELLALGSCAEPGGATSPLAEGPADPLIWAHFQIDDVGQLTLPTLPTPDGEPGRDVDEIQLAILEELECTSSHQLAALRRPPAEQERQPRASGRGGLAQVGAFRWHAATLRDEDAFVALRDVHTPRAVLTQGFVVRAESLERLVADGPFPVRIVPGPPGDEAGEARIPLAGDDWTVRLDPRQAILEAERQATGLRREFRLGFVGGSLLALLAGAAIVLMVHQSERVAAQRARLAAAAAHELRTPLASLQLYGEMLADGSGSPDRGREYAARIALETERLGRVVTNVLGFARLERGKLVLRPTVGELGSAVSEAAERLRPALAAEGAALEVEIEPGLPQLAFDRDAVDGILRNLVDNAERYSRGCADRRITVGLSARDGGQALTVADRGVGVAAGRSRRGEPENPGSGQGLGIGLKLVRALAAAQGAEVSHRPRPGGGTVFCVLFPRSA
jgi:signal transduction histidine kinase